MNWAFTLLCFFIFCSLTHCQRCATPNECIISPNTPYCFNGVCVQCDPHAAVPLCGCPAGEYCVTDPHDSAIGSCKPFEEDIIGRPCQATLKDLVNEVTLNVNDQMFCGMIKFNGTRARWLEWEGSCVRGVCYECSIAPFTIIPYAICHDARQCLRDGTMGYAPVGVFSETFIMSNPIVFIFMIISGCLLVTGLLMILLFGSLLGYDVYKLVRSFKKSKVK